MISCLMVTQPGRIALARMAIADFAAQTHRECELLVLHDGDGPCHVALEHAAAEHAAAIRVVRQPAGRTLGWLRNAAVAAAAGDHVCQWDDDDRYHPQRLALQWQALHDANADFCFLSDQLHWFAASAQMFWDDWDREAYPFNLVQGSLLGKRSRMPQYPDQARGEDTDLLVRILRSGDVDRAPARRRLVLRLRLSWRECLAGRTPRGDFAGEKSGPGGTDPARTHIAAAAGRIPSRFRCAAIST